MTKQNNRVHHLIIFFNLLIILLFYKGHKYNPFYALLKMRYNFSCLIFESKLFDVDLYFKFNITNQKMLQQSQQSQQSTGSGIPNPYSFGSVGISLTGGGGAGANGININDNQQSQMNYGHNNQGNASNGNSIYQNNFNYQNSIDVFSSCLTTSQANNKELINSFPQSVGLLEVLPLSYKFFSCSNGTQMEKNNSKQESNLYVLPNFFTVFDNKKSDSNQVTKKNYTLMCVRNISLTSLILIAYIKLILFFWFI